MCYYRLFPTPLISEQEQTGKELQEVCKIVVDPLVELCPPDAWPPIVIG